MAEESHKIVFATDLHGRHAIKRVLEIAVEQGAKSVVFGGDICPKIPLVELRDGTLIPGDFVRTSAENHQLMLDLVKTLNSHGHSDERTERMVRLGYYLHKDHSADFEELERDPEKLRGVLQNAFKHGYSRGQLSFVKDWFLPTLKQFHEKNPGIKVFAMPGNDDVPGILEHLNKAQADGYLSQLHGNAHRLDANHWIAGYSGVPRVPLRSWTRTEKQITAELEALATLSDPSRTVYSIHSPPYGSNLDMAGSPKKAVRAGSRAVMGFIKKHKPPVTLHGHIHENPEITGAYHAVIGSTVSFQPGRPEGKGASKAQALVFDLYSPKSYKIVN